MADIVGTTGDDTLVGTSGADTIHADSGNDFLNGGADADVMEGGAGNDVFIVDNIGDAVIENQNEGADTVYALISYILTAGSHVEVLSTISWTSNAALNLTGNSFANTLYGNAGANTLNGGAGADILFGFGGADVYIVDNAGDAVIESAGQGADTVYALVSYALTAGSHVEVLSTIDWTSTAALNLTGNDLANRIYGNAGANMLDGGGGADILSGFGGADVYFVDNIGDVVIEAQNQGFDTVYARASYALTEGSYVESLSAIDWSSTAALNLTGNSFANAIYGNAGANTLDGFGGADAMSGFGGADVYIVDNAGDAVIEAQNQGFDTVYAMASYALTEGSHVEILSSISWSSTAALNLAGNGLANTIYGNAGANILDGGGGSDTLYGFAGPDTFAFTTALGAGNVDTIADFSIFEFDKIRLAGAAGQPFAALATGFLQAGTLVTGTAALDSDDYLIYNSATGALFYDADGNGAGAAVQFATLSTGLNLNTGSFEVSGAPNNAPTISSGATASVAENSSASTIVYQVVASDADGDRITYSVGGNDGAFFTVDASGAVRLIDPANFEVRSSYSFTVFAADSNNAGSKTVTLTVTDVLEGTPTINETAAANDSTGTAQAIDRGTFVVADNPNLPDDSLPSATIVGDVSTSTDRDFFSITLQAGEKLILDVDNSGGNLDAHVRVYGPGGTEIGANDDPGGFDPGSTAHPTYGHNTDSFFSFRAPTAGTYYFSIESFQDALNPTLGSYEINVSIAPPATPAQLIEEDIEALISGSAWPTATISYSFPDAAGDYPQDFGDPLDPEPASFAQFTPTQQAAVQLMLQHISNVTTLTFQQFTGANDGTAKLRYAMTDATEAAHAYYPGNYDEAGSAWFNKDDFNNPVKGNYAWMGILHETGHALGLKHGHEPPAISPDRDSLEYSVMTYRSFPGDTTIGGYGNETFGFPQTLMMYDIAALQRIYDGANWTFNSGNSVYTWSPSTGEMSINGAGQGAPGANRVFMTVWDGGGNDTYDLTAYSSATTIDLRPGEWTITSPTQTANLGGGHFARGNIANALLFEGDTRSLIENAIGGQGNDTIIANQAANLLTGNSGADIFKWMSSGDAGTGPLADAVLDFALGSDKLDLSAIDANAGMAGDQAFTFIGSSAFHNVAGEVRWEVGGNGIQVFADLNGDGLADMQIEVRGTQMIAATDFFL